MLGKLKAERMVLFKVVWPMLKVYHARHRKPMTQLDQLDMILLVETKGVLLW